MRRTKTRSPYFSSLYGKQGLLRCISSGNDLQKQSHIGKTHWKFINFCDLTGTDAEYFAALVHFNKAKSDRDSKFYYEKLLALRGVKTHSLEESQYEFYTKWYYTAILTLLDFYSFSGDYKSLAARLSPPVTETEAKKAIALLKNWAY
jgi:uncharacterized protein (TIGR02147 family)